MRRLAYAGSVFFMFAMHAGLAFDTARRSSVVWDEAVYPLAGYDLLRQAQIRLSMDHPPLGKALLALPYLVTRPPYQPDLVLAGDAFHSGFQFLHRQPGAARRILESRCMAIVCSLLLGALVFWWAIRWGGPMAGWIAAFLYLCAPPILARASFSLLEIPLTMFMTLSAVAYLQWRRSRHIRALILWITAVACALLVKATALLLFPIFLLSDAWRVETEVQSRWQRWLETCLVISVALAFAECVMQILGSSYVGAQLMPRHQYVFHNSLPMYFLGQSWPRALWFFAPVVLAIKWPIGITLLSAVGLRDRDAEFRNRREFFLGLGYLVVGAAVLLSVRSIIVSAHYLWMLPPMCVLAGVGSVSLWRISRAGRATVAVSVFSVLVSTLWIHPHYGAYVNILGGGSEKGWRRVADSDQDWGQGLPSVARWMKAKNIEKIILAYSGAGDPRLYGIAYQDLVSPALISRYYRGEIYSPWTGPLRVVVGTKLLQSEPALFAWPLAHRKPTELIGSTFMVFDFSNDREAQEWLDAVYRATRRPGLRVQP